MTVALPPELTVAVSEGRAVLFLGAGASRGSKNDKGQEIPLARDLAKELAVKFLGSGYEDYDFRSVYDLSCSQRDVPTVQRFLHDRLNEFLPADFHAIIPTLPWAGLLTTNYDLIVERAYNKAQSPVQKLVPNTKDGDGSGEQIVHLRRDPKSGDYVYEARHSHIADVVYEAALTTQDQRFDNLVRIVSKLNPTFSYDLEVLSRIIKADHVEKIVSDPNRGRQVYDAAIAAAGRHFVVMHQRGIYEMHVAANFPELDRAEEHLREALELDKRNPTIKHSLAELDLRRSKMATNPLERAAWRQRATAAASDLTTNSKNSYPHSTLVKAAIDDVRDALPAAESSDVETSVLRLGDAIVAAEDVLKRALQAYPNDPVLLALEGELSTVLAQAERAETAFRRALLANPRSTLIARRLARIQRSKGNFAELRFWRASPTRIKLTQTISCIICIVRFPLATGIIRLSFGMLVSYAS